MSDGADVLLSGLGTCVGAAGLVIERVAYHDSELFWMSFTFLAFAAVSGWQGMSRLERREERRAALERDRSSGL